MKHQNSIDRAILERILNAGPGKVHAPKDFLDLGSRAAVDQALSRNTRAGRLRKVTRGLYDLPWIHRIWGPIASPPEAVVEALARRDNLTVVPDTVTRTFLTDGRSRRLRHGKSEIRLKHASPRTLARRIAAAGEIT